LVPQQVVVYLLVIVINILDYLLKIDQFVLLVEVIYDKKFYNNNNFYLQLTYDVSGDSAGDVDVGTG
jgi:hypothetical protein